MTTQRRPVLDRLITIPVRSGTQTPLTLNPWGQPVPSAAKPSAMGRVWAERRDFTGRNTLEVSQTAVLPIVDTRYTIRAEVGTALKVGDTLTDENGEVRGIAEMGRQYLELLTRRIG